MVIIASTLFLASAAFLKCIAIPAGRPPKTRDFLANFGASNEHENHQGRPNMSPQREYSPDEESFPAVPLRESSPPPERNFFAVKPLSPDRAHHPATSPPPGRTAYTADHSLRVRSRSPPTVLITPPTKIDFATGCQYKLEQLECIRLTCTNNPHRKLALRRYTFPADKAIRVLLQKNVYSPMPIQEQIVLSTADGDVFAILQEPNLLAGIYSHYGRKNGRGRAKINMRSGKITALTKDEIRQIPVGQTSKFLLNYKVEYIKHNPPQQ